MTLPAPTDSGPAARVRVLNDAPLDKAGDYVLYWMQCAQRVQGNFALAEAIAQANALGIGVVVCFGLDPDYPDANARHMGFMLEGLAEVELELAALGIRFELTNGAPDDVCLAHAPHAALVVCDRGYLRQHRAWRSRIASTSGKRVLEVEGEVVVPVDSVSGKREYAARTLRPKLNRVLEAWLEPATVARPRVSVPPSPPRLSDPRGLLKTLPIDQSVGPSSRFTGGPSKAADRLTTFIQEGLSGYARGRNNPGSPQCSNLSPYLHFGQIGPVEITNAVRAYSSEDAAVFLEELVVRRELAFNYVWNEPDYDRYESLPAWAQKTLDAHRHDPRATTYDAGELEAARTHDPYWNAAMTEMRQTGFMHGYMRMYWGKKIIEWSNTPEQAFCTALALNNKYFLDGRDPNSYAGVGWVFGLHDRPWARRPVFGTVRYMAASGLERKFDIRAYAAWAAGL
tara:strand:- start:789 stop:2153 length:1365 start_codon:yes stop_codon:yes gene_type:complete